MLFKRWIGVIIFHISPLERTSRYCTARFQKDTQDNDFEIFVAAYIASCPRTRHHDFVSGYLPCRTFPVSAELNEQIHVSACSRLIFCVDGFHYRGFLLVR